MSLCLLYASCESCKDIVNLIRFFFLVGLKLVVIEGVNVDVLDLVGCTRFYLKVLGVFVCLFKGNERRC